jgi:hypothetical protein
VGSAPETHHLLNLSLGRGCIVIDGWSINTKIAGVPIPGAMS